MKEGKKYKAYSKKQLTRLYNISEVTLRSWLRPIENKLGTYRGKAYSPIQIKMIFDFLGEPEVL